VTESDHRLGKGGRLSTTEEEEKNTKDREAIRSQGKKKANDASGKSTQAEEF